jgi:hypothetical protein
VNAEIVFPRRVENIEERNLTAIGATGRIAMKR